MIDLSFVVIGRNAAWCIGRLLDSVVARLPSHLKTEIIYVDSASSDGTIEVAGRYPVKILQLSADQPLCASAGRYVGSRHAEGKYIFFLDSDMELLDGWLEKALAALEEHPEVAAISGVIFAIDRTLPPDEAPPIDYSSYGDPQLTDIPFAGNAAIFRRSVLNAAGTWNPYITSEEEPELCFRIRNAGYRIVQLEWPVTRHYTEAPGDIAGLLARRRRRLYSGTGQIIRYHLGERLLLAYLAERGFALLPGAAALVAIACAILSWVQRDPVWIYALLAVLAGVLAGDAIRTRSLRKPLYHVLHRAILLEGMIKGLLMRPYPPSQYPAKVTVVRPEPAAPARPGSSGTAPASGEFTFAL